MNKTLRSCRTISLTLLLGSLALPALAEDNVSASLQVAIMDDTGSPVQDAHIYIFSRNKQQFFGTQKTQGGATINLPAGDYRLYAAKAIDVNGVIDHYSSPEAFVHLTAEDPCSVILALQKAVPSELILSDAARATLGIDERIAKTPTSRPTHLQ